MIIYHDRYVISMEESNDRSIKKWVEENSSVSAVAAELTLSRPTVYKYMEKFDKGETDKLPEDVVTYFEQKLTPKDDPKYIRMRMEVMDKMMELTSRLAMEKARASELLMKRDSLACEIAALKKSSKDDPESIETMRKMEIEMDVLTKESMKCSDNMHVIEDRLAEVKAKLSELENVKYVPETTKPIFNIKSSCFIENGKCMVVHTGDKTTTFTVNNGPEQQEPLYYRLHLYAKIGNEFAHLGDYLPVKNRNFFIIDDVFLSAPLYYNIVACIEDQGYDDTEGEFARPEGEPNLIELSGSESTGMCELKQRK